LEAVLLTVNVGEGAARLCEWPSCARQRLARNKNEKNCLIVVEASISRVVCVHCMLRVLLTVSIDAAAVWCEVNMSDKHWRV
jgi:hypothetical protein